MDYVIFDIDGTLADCEHRLHFILNGEIKDWPSFDAGIPEDKPIHNMIHMAQLLRQAGKFIVMLTGRNERTRVATLKWLKTFDIPFDSLLMRGMHDHRPASIIKMEFLELYDLKPEDVMTIFEDEPKTIRAMRDAGYHVCDVLEWKDGYAESLEKGGRDA